MSVYKVRKALYRQIVGKKMKGRLLSILSVFMISILVSTVASAAQYTKMAVALSLLSILVK